MVKIVHISIFYRLLNFITHKTYLDELQNNYKTEKVIIIWAFSTGPWLQLVLNSLPKFSCLLGTFSTGWGHDPVLNGAA